MMILDIRFAYKTEKRCLTFRIIKWGKTKGIIGD